MKNQYYNEMVEMLLSHPEGMRLNSIVRSIYNNNCDLFARDSSTLFNSIYTSVKRYLWRQSRLQRSPFERRRWGIYSLRSNFVYQLELDFDDWEEEGIELKQPKIEPDKPKAIMLDLFADYAF